MLPYRLRAAHLGGTTRTIGPEITMRGSSSILLSLVLSACVRGTVGAPDRVRDASWAELEQRLRARVVEAPPGEVAVAIVDLGGGRRLGVNAEVPMHAASTMKVPVLLELFRQAEAGLFTLEDTLEIRTTFRSIADGSEYALSPEDDSETALYGEVGRGVALRELARRMIVRSSNLATNLLIERLTADSIQATLARLGAGGMRVLRGVEDGPAYRRGLNNTTTAHGFARVLEAIARCEVTSRAACDEMLEILSAQEDRRRIPAGLPPGVRVAHKTGWITAVYHDGGIVYPQARAPYVLVILTRGIADTARSTQVAVEISRDVWSVLGDPDTAASSTGECVASLRQGRSPSPRHRRCTHADPWGLLAPIVDGSRRSGRRSAGIRCRWRVRLRTRTPRVTPESMRRRP